MLSNIEFQRQLDSAKNKIDNFVDKKFDQVKLELSSRKRKENSKKAAVALAAYLVGKTPYVGSLLSTAVKTICHDKTSGEILDAALAMYNIADIYMKEIHTEVTQKTLVKLAKAELYIELADELMEYINFENQSFVQPVKLLLKVKKPVIQRHLKSVLPQPQEMELDTF
ncbi:hypothetical protein [Psychromonas aquimarina]|uniref:hypothetical protein n=1 Tax=Psychromonas aquimarina TaxID=444919 RepID=UPI0003F68EB7|nr:hypothetical protein [Psychromonas aquimarina]